MQTMKRSLALVIITALVFTLVSCGGTGTKETTRKAGEYSWGNVTFSVKKVNEEKSGDSRQVYVELDFGDQGISKMAFESAVTGGKILFKDQKPNDQYQYRMTGSGNIVGAGLYFPVDADYEFDRNDLVITE